MKGYLACVLALVPNLLQRKLKTPIHIVFSYDEEVGCTGVRPMIAELGSRLPKPRLVFVGEPTSMDVVDAHKGPVRWSVDVTGRAAHSSMAPLGVNAITYAARLLGEIEAIEKDLRDGAAEPAFRSALSDTAGHRDRRRHRLQHRAADLPFRFRGARAPRARRRSHRTAPAGLRRDTLPSRDATRCAGGRRSPSASRTASRLSRRATSSEAVALALKLAGRNDTRAVSYATEAGLFQAAGVPSVICGPGDIAQAHTANEWVARSELDACMGFLNRLADWAEA